MQAGGHVIRLREHNNTFLAVSRRPGTTQNRLYCILNRCRQSDGWQDAAVIHFYPRMLWLDICVRCMFILACCGLAFAFIACSSSHAVAWRLRSSHVHPRMPWLSICVHRMFFLACRDLAFACSTYLYMRLCSMMYDVT